MRYFTALILLFLGLFNSHFNPVSAAILKFNSTTFSISQGEKKQVTVILDTEGKKAFGAVATIKITSGTDVIRINNILPAAGIDTNELRVTDSASSQDNRVSFTVIKEVGSYFEGVSNLAILEVEGLKSGNAKIDIVTSDSEPSTVADFDTNNELLSTLGSATFNSSSNDSADEDDEEEDEDDNDNNGSSSNSNSSTSNSSSGTTTSSPIPQTGNDIYFYILLSSLGLVVFSFVIRRAVGKV